MREAKRQRVEEYLISKQSQKCCRWKFGTIHPQARRRSSQYPPTPSRQALRLVPNNGMKDIKRIEEGISQIPQK